MQTVNQLFVKDFKKMMTIRASSGLNVNLQMLSNGQEYRVNKNMGYIKGIKEPFYERLNKSKCTIIYKTKVGKPQVKADGTYRLDEEGKEVVDHIPVPREAVLICTTVNIMLRKKTQDGADYEEKENFRYIRYVDKIEKGERTRYFYYIVPREHVYKVNLTALIITKNRRKNYYNGLRVALVDGSYAYLYTVPHKGVREDTFVIYTEATTDYSSLLLQVANSWVQQGYAFDYVSCQVELPDKGEINVAYQVLAPTLFHEDYVPYKATLKEEQDITVIE